MLLLRLDHKKPGTSSLLYWDTCCWSPEALCRKPDFTEVAMEREREGEREGEKGPSELQTFTSQPSLGARLESEKLRYDSSSQPSGQSQLFIQLFLAEAPDVVGRTGPSLLCPV